MVERVGSHSVTSVLTSDLRINRILADEGQHGGPWRMAKRSTAVSVKMTAEDFLLLKKAAAHLWPGAPLTASTLVLALAKIGAEHVLRREKKP